ncbi:MAG: DEAD/DEAH box helicase [Proteobacteria bacterium]|nr:DEAD/DEAH box helicase [Pseudomonadota bacterium]
MTFLFPIQSATFLPIFNKKDLIGRDRTGSGKTLAFCLPVLERFRKEKKFQRKRGQLPFMMIIVPTRELCIQVAKEFERFQNNEREYRVQKVYGGKNI